MNNIQALWQKGRDFMVKLRNADDRVKRRYMIWGSAVTSGLVIFIWIGYMSLLVETTSPPEGAPRQIAVIAIERSQEGFLATVGNGVRIVVKGALSGASRLIASVKDIFGQTHSIEIKGGGDKSLPNSGNQSP